jgi:hypothetical protein
MTIFLVTRLMERTTRFGGSCALGLDGLRASCQPKAGVRERVVYPHTLNVRTMVHVFAKKCLRSTVNGCRDDVGIVKGQMMLLSHF